MLCLRLRGRDRVMTCIAPCRVLSQIVGTWGNRSIRVLMIRRERGSFEGTYQPRAALESDRRESAVVRNCMFAV